MTHSLFSFNLIKRLFSPSSISAIRVMSSRYLGLLIPYSPWGLQVRHNWATEHAHMHTISLPCFAFSLRIYTRCSGPCFPLLPSKYFWLKLLFSPCGFAWYGVPSKWNSFFFQWCWHLFVVHSDTFHKSKWSLQQRCNKDIYSTVMPLVLSYEAQLCSCSKLNLSRV